MSTLARNAACPCGSGVKLKRCCLPRADRARNAAREHDRVGADILEWAHANHRDALDDAYGPTAFDRARGRGFGWRQVFVTWALIDFAPTDGGAPLAARYAARSDLDPATRDVAGRVAGARLAAHRVTGVASGLWIELQPLEGGSRTHAMSADVSTGARVGHVALGRLMAGPPDASLWGPVRLFGAETERKWRAAGRAIGSRGPESALAVLRFEPDDHAEPLPDGLAPLTSVWAVHDDELLLEELEAMPGVSGLGLEIGSDDDWVFAWLDSRDDGAADLGGRREEDGRIEAARLVVGRDRLTVSTTSTSLLAEIGERLARVADGIVEPVATELRRAA